jgi:hypothetical protein
MRIEARREQPGFNPDDKRNQRRLQGSRTSRRASTKSRASRLRRKPH